MTRIERIQAALPNLTPHELQILDAALRAEFRERKIGILYDDAYGVWTEEDQASAAAQAFTILDQEESRAL